MMGINTIKELLNEQNNTRNFSHMHPLLKGASKYFTDTAQAQSALDWE